MSKFKKCFVLLLLFCLIGINSQSAFAKNNSTAKTGKVTVKTVGAGALSLIVWPGIGQAVNNNKGEKVLTHAVLGLLVPYRVWSCYDAVVDRQGGYWDGRI